jgi:hypothetical protein
MLWLVVIVTLIALLTLWLSAQGSPEPVPARVAERRHRHR